MGGPPLTLEQRQMVHRLRGKGFSWEKIARAAGCSLSGALAMTGPAPGAADNLDSSSRSTDIADREEIVIGLAQGRDVHRHRQSDRQGALHGQPGSGGERWAPWIPGLGRALRAQSRPVVPNQPRLASCPALLARGRRRPRAALVT